MALKQLSTQAFGLNFNTPIVLLSGCVGFGEEYCRVEGFSYRSIGGIFLKGTTMEPRLGNAPQRIVEIEGGMINAIGLQNPGAKYVSQDILPFLDYQATHFIANVSGSSVEEFSQLCEWFDDSPVSAIEINISCPNIKEGGLIFGNDPVASSNVVSACRAKTKKPLIVKLSPNQTNIAYNAMLCIEAGADALAVTNTFTGMAIDIDARRPIIRNNQGGVSGSAIKPQALLRVHQVYQESKKHRIPIIGQGGICSAEDALEFLIAGAQLVGIGTALFYDPHVIHSINNGMMDYLKKHQLTLEELVGSLQVYE